MQTQPRTSENRSVATLVADFANGTGELVRKEIELAKVEVSENISNAVVAIESFAAGGALAFAGLLVLLAAAVLGLNEWLQRAWLSALIVGVTALLVAAAFAIAGRRKVREEAITPTRSPRSLRHDKDLALKHI
jgi:uncharacterized membrane protein YqjE